jgi:hypothetical protein
MTDEEELNLKREENRKLDEEGDRLFFVRLGRFALVVNFITPFVILPGFAVWRALETHFDAAWSKPFFWNNLGWLLLRDLYAVGAFGIICSVIYLAGGERGWKLCGLPNIFSESAGPLMFWPFVFMLIFPYAFFVFAGMGCIGFYEMWIK